VSSESSFSQSFVLNVYILKIRQPLENYWKYVKVIHACKFKLLFINDLSHRIVQIHYMGMREST
jgi:hypothetical protein